MMLSSLQAHRRFLGRMAGVLCAVAGTTIGLVAISMEGQDRNTQWVASWATSPAAYLVYVPPVTQNQALVPAPVALFPTQLASSNSGR